MHPQRNASIRSFLWIALSFGVAIFTGLAWRSSDIIRLVPFLSSGNLGLDNIQEEVQRPAINSGACWSAPSQPNSTEILYNLNINISTWGFHVLALTGSRDSTASPCMTHEPPEDRLRRNGVYAWFLCAPLAV